MESGDPQLWPTTSTMRVIQDKMRQKQTLAAAGLPVARFFDAPTREAVMAAAANFGWPVLLKKRRNSYDGKGNATVRGPEELGTAWQKLGGDRNALYAEDFVPFTKELAVMITRTRDGHTAIYPVVETTQYEHICHIVKAPAPNAEQQVARVREIAIRAVETVDGVGS